MARIDNLPAVPFIRMQDPLKQGLKPIWTRTYLFLVRNSNARSTKTRIETLLGVQRAQREDQFECKIH